MKHLNRDTLQKLFVTLAVFICLLLSVGITARADSEGAATVTASALNMRSEASTSSSIVTCVSKGTVVLVTGSSDGWYQVWYQGQSGYMSADYLSFSTSAESAFGTGTISANSVRVRSGPSTSDTILATVNSGETMSVTGVSGEWYRVSYNGSVGYVHSAYMTISYGSSSTSASTSTSTTEEAPLAVAATGTGTINGNYVRMRSGPSTSYSILGTYNSGTTMTVTGTSGDWYQVSYNGTTGYVYSLYLTLDSGSTSTSTSTSSSASSTSSFTVTEMDDTAATVTSAVHMRTGPSTSYASLQVLSAGTSVTITGYSGNWYRISYNGSTGYVYGSYVTTDTSSNTASSLSSSSSSTSTSAGEAIVAEAKKYLGVSYVYGGTSPSGFDCSGLVYYVYKQCGYSITRTASSQNSDGTYVSRDNLQPGDIIVFYNSAMTGIGHVGIYIGDGQFIHASSGSGKVVISSLSATYYNSHYYSARRIVS
ncbi:MAG: SH3 domain-containing protein [Oscillospiraceae bacterium]|nr:SH3 domain-containing protein [Oscillospiraceae bacterium]